MQVTAVGILLIPLGVFAAAARSSLPLLVLITFFAPFSATAVLNVTSPPFGLQPAYFFGLLLIARLSWNLAMGERLTLAVPQRRVAASMLLLLVAGLASVALIPIYSPAVLVSRPSGLMEPLMVTRENVTQLIYLFFVVLVTIAIALRNLSRGQVCTILRTFIVAGLFVSLWGWFQIAVDFLGWTYPDQLFNNSASFSQLFAQKLPGLGIKRMSSVAPEPSMLARFLLVPLAISLHSLAIGGSVVMNRRLAGLISVFLALTTIMTTSSTAILGLVATAGLLVLFGASARRRHVSALNARGVIIVFAAVPALALFVALVILGLTIEQLRLALDVLLFGKLESVSGQGRLAGGLNALKLFATHPVLGVGWGSNRSFDLGTNLASNLGLTGLVVFGWLHAVVLVPAFRVAARFRTDNDERTATLLEALGLALLALLAGKLMAEPGVAYVDHWLLVGLLASSLVWRSTPASLPR